MSAKKNDEVFRKLRAKVGHLANQKVKVGVLQSRGGGDSIDDRGTTLAELLAIHEYGAPGAGIPARAPLRRALEDDEAKAEVTEQTAKVARAVVADRISVEQGLGILGEWAVARVKKGIKDHLPPPLKPATIKRKTVDGKEGDVPLVDSGHLIGSINYEVTKK